MNRLIKSSLAIAAIVVLSGCVGSTPSAQEENALGAQQERKVLSQVQTIRSGKYYNRVKSVGARIASASGRSDFKWKYHLVKNDKQANAFVLPGGKIFVYTGLFKYASTQAELAAVIGHEVAHALKSHGVKGSQRQKTAGVVGILLQVGMGVAGVNTQIARQVTQAYGYGATLGYIKPYSRSNESEADKIGLMLMAKAGYNPKAALSFWNKFAKQGQRVPEYLSTHPAPQNRIAQIQELMPEALAIYNKSPYKNKR